MNTHTHTHPALKREGKKVEALRLLSWEQKRGIIKRDHLIISWVCSTNYVEWDGIQLPFNFPIGSVCCNILTIYFHFIFLRLSFLFSFFFLFKYFMRVCYFHRTEGGDENIYANIKIHCKMKIHCENDGKILIFWLSRLLRFVRFNTIFEGFFGIWMWCLHTFVWRVDKNWNDAA